jgi:hypothetical protein
MLADQAAASPAWLGLVTDWRRAEAAGLDLDIALPRLAARSSDGSTDPVAVLGDRVERWCETASPGTRALRTMIAGLIPAADPEICRALGERAGVAKQRAETLAAAPRQRRSLARHARATTRATGATHPVGTRPLPPLPPTEIATASPTPADHLVSPAVAAMDTPRRPTTSQSSRRRRTPDLGRRVSQTGYDASPPASNASLRVSRRARSCLDSALTSRWSWRGRPLLCSRAQRWRTRRQALSSPLGRS